VSGRRTFVAEEILTASNINSFLMNQVIPVFDDEADRDVAIPSPIQGQFVFLKNASDVNGLLLYDGTNWRTVLLEGFTSPAIARDTALGNGALVSNTTGFSNTAIGFEALTANTSGTSNTAVGRSALSSNTTGIRSVAVGREALKDNTTGQDNTAVGREALASNTTAQNNTAIGFSALQANTTGNFNVAIGGNAMLANVAGASNVAVGQGSLPQITISTSIENTAIGQQAGSNLLFGSNNTFIGAFSTPSAGTRSNQITLGDSNINSLRCNTTSISSLSDRRDKKDIQDLPLGLEFVNQLRPVEFTWARRDGSMGSKPDIGFIAQEMAELEDSIGETERLNLTLRDDPEKIEASPGRLIPILVKAIQDLSARIDELEA
jgi:hypothetical protein